MAQASLSHAECSAIHILREMANDPIRKQVKRELFARAKAQFAIPPEHKLVVETDILQPNAGILKNKATREAYDLDASGKWVHAQNGANAAKRWFKLAASDLYTAVTEAMDSADASGDNIHSQADQPAANMIVDAASSEAIVIDAQGNLWVQLDADSYGETTDSEEEDEDLPF